MDFFSINKKTWIVEFVRTGDKFQTTNKRNEVDSKAWRRQKLLETFKDYNSNPSKFKRSSTLKEAFTREFRANEFSCKNDREKAIELSISNIKVYSK